MDFVSVYISIFLMLWKISFSIFEMHKISMKITLKIYNVE